MRWRRGRGLPIVSPRRMRRGILPEGRGPRPIVARPSPHVPVTAMPWRFVMFRRAIALLLLAFMVVNAVPAFAAETPPGPVAPEVLAAGSVEISRNSAENPMAEITRSMMWGALAGL